MGDEANIAADGVDTAILEALQRRAQFEPAQDEEEDELWRNGPGWTREEMERLGGSRGHGDQDQRQLTRKLTDAANRVASNSTLWWKVDEFWQIITDTKNKYPTLWLSTRDCAGIARIQYAQKGRQLGLHGEQRHMGG